jgi:hypothetical protein
VEKRIAALTIDPHTVSLTDRKCSLFIDPKTASIFVDEGDGEGRMIGPVFSSSNGPTFAVQPSTGPDHGLVLGYRGIEYMVGISGDANELRQWADSANRMMEKAGSRAALRERKVSRQKNRKKGVKPRARKTVHGATARSPARATAQRTKIAQARARPQNAKRKSKGKRK